MNIAVIATIALVTIGIWLEKNRRCARRDNPYNLIDLQEEIRRRAEIRNKEQNEDR